MAVAPKQGADIRYDGVVVFWVDPTPPPVIPAQTADDRPIVVVATSAVAVLRSRVRELRALQDLHRYNNEKQTMSG